jgi:predicted aspartyl protease
MLMETEPMGRVLTEAKVENLGDLLEVDRGQRAPEAVRRLLVSDALVDTGATTLSLPSHLIQQLGLKKRYEKPVRTAAGLQTASVYDAVRLTIMDRDCTVDVMEEPDSIPVLIGQVPLEVLDLVVDPKGRRLIGNPAHDGVQTFEMY